MRCKTTGIYGVYNLILVDGHSKNPKSDLAQGLKSTVCFLQNFCQINHNQRWFQAYKSVGGFWLLIWENPECCLSWNMSYLYREPSPATDFFINTIIILKMYL